VLAWRRVEQLLARPPYPHLAATREPAKTSVTALRRRFAEAEEATAAFPAAANDAAAPPARRSRQGSLSAADTGTAHHRFLQCVALERTGSPAELEAEAKRLTEAGKLSADERAVLDFAVLAEFWSSPVGQRIRQHAGSVRRELGFTARFSPEEFRRVIGATPTPELADECVVVQGVADLVVLQPAELWLLDFKTDAIAAGEVAERTRRYQPQLQLYALALARIYGRPVTELWLHFLARRQTVSLPVAAGMPDPLRKL
jgi:ATP-dependent helicase/nuclease subunit A